MCPNTTETYPGRWYDSGVYGRPLCSAECYSKWYDEWRSALEMDAGQKAAHRKASLEHYRANKPKWREYQKKRYDNKEGLAGAI